MFPALWTAAVAYNVDPVGVVAQSAKETSFGHYGGAVLPEQHNTCGLKVRAPGYAGLLTDGDNTLAHQTFWSWEVGALAHVQHLRAYAGWPVDGMVVDPRYQWVVGRYRCEQWAELGGRWAPSPTYGLEIETVMGKLRA
jgi:N-acetylmuramoyl-L-alanine amidase